MADSPTSSSTLAKLVSVCRNLTDHLSGYAVEAENFDEDAFLACEMAETLLAEVERLYGPLDAPQVRSELLDAARKRAEDE